MILRKQATANPRRLVICDGDSLTWGENASSGAGSSNADSTTYPGVLQRILGDRYEVINLGRGGCTVAQMASDARGRVDILLSTAILPPIVVIEGGTNDFGIDPLIAPPLSPMDAALFVLERLRSYWTARHMVRSDCLVVDVTNTPAAHWAYPKDFNERRRSLNLFRRQSMEATGQPDALAMVDEDECIGKDGCEQNPLYFHLKDKTHLTDAGYARKAEIIAATILNLSYDSTTK